MRNLNDLRFWILARRVGTIAASMSFVANCSSLAPSQISTATIPENDTPTVVQLGTIEATGTSSVIATVQTSIPTSSTPVPTLPFDQRLEFLLEFVQTNGGCKLPCLWGFEPGITPIGDVALLLGPLGYRLPEHGSMEDSMELVYGFAINEAELVNLNLSLHTEEGKIVRIQINADGINRQPGDPLHYPKYDQALEILSLSNVLKAMGTPDSILLDVPAGVAEQGAPWLYTMWITFEDIGAILMYEGEVLGIVKATDNIRICPMIEETTRIQAYLQSEEYAENLEAWAMPFGSSIESVTNLDPLLFHDLFTKEMGEDCFETPRSYWLNGDG